MPDAIVVSAPVSGTTKTMTFETGKLAPQADGAVVGRIGDTMVLVTATAARKVREGTDFFPLTVDIEERMYAAGKIPGSFFRREGRASDQAILTCRLIDRPLRPSFPKGFRNEVHIVGTILGADLMNPHDVLAINTASAALMVSGIPFDGPIGAVRIAWSTEGRWIPHATYQEGDASCFELVVAGRALSEEPDSEIAIMMVEAGGTEDSFRFYAEGPRRSPRRSWPTGSRWPRPGSGSPSSSSAGSWPPPAASPPFPTRSSRTTARTCWPGSRRSASRRWPRPTPSPRRPSATRPSTGPPPASSSSSPPSSPSASRRSSPPCGPHEEAGAPAHRRRGDPHRRPWSSGPSAPLGRGGPHPHGPRLGPVPAG